MFYLISVHLIEAASVVLFLLALRQALKDSRYKAAELFFAFVYGLILEELDIFFFRTYHYGPGFFLQLGNAPLAIAFLWSLIITSSMAISDRLGIRGFAKPFLDGLLAVLIDIGVDAVAIRIGYWTWTIPLTEGWFGVPAGNLWSWIWVAFSYSAVTRLVRWFGRRDAGRYAYQILAPFGAYLILFTVIVLVGLVTVRFGLRTETQRLWIFYGHVAVFAAVAGVSRRTAKSVEPSSPVLGILRASRLLIHLYFLAALLVTGMVLREPLIACAALAAFSVELAVNKRMA